MRRSISVLASIVVGLSGLLLEPTPDAVAVDTPTGRLVSASPATATPHVRDGRVLSVVRVGNLIVLGGTFTSAVNNGAGQPVLTRNRLLAFNATTGRISTSFNPAPNGAVNVVLPAADRTSVYVGGTFTSIGGVARSRLARVRVSDGVVLSSFNAGAIPAAVKDLRLKGVRLWVAGTFTRVGARTQPGLTTVSAETGAAQPFMSLPVTGVHNTGTTSVRKIDIGANGSRLVAVGNFSAVGGQTRRQIFMLDLTGTSATLPTGTPTSTRSRVRHRHSTPACAMSTSRRTVPSSWCRPPVPTVAWTFVRHPVAVGDDGHRHQLAPLMGRHDRR